MKDFSIRDFFLGIFVTLLILVPLFFFFMLPRHYQGLNADQNEIQEQLNILLDKQPELSLKIEHLIWLMDDFEDQMNERTKLITRDMPSKVTEIKLSEED